MPDLQPDNRPWWSLLNRYHWYVFALAALGWLFDTMDGQIFVMSRANTMADLMQDDPFETQVKYGTYVTTIFILGWATGGLLLGMLGDRWGRAKTMALTILIYAVFTGLSGIARDWVEFSCYRFLTGVGVGGEFAAGAALVAEVMPERARAKSLGLLQALSAIGNIFGVLLYWQIELRYGWRVLYFVGAFPAIMAVYVMLGGLKEPEKWVAARQAARNAPKGSNESLGRISELFSSPVLRRNTLVGLALGIAGVVGMWSAAYLHPELVESAFPKLAPEAKAKLVAIADASTPRDQAAAIAALQPAEMKSYRNIVTVRFPKALRLAPTELASRPLDDARRQQLTQLLATSKTPAEMTKIKTWAGLMMQIGCFFGAYFFGVVAVAFGRRPAFLISFVMAWFGISMTFWFFHSPSQIYYLYPLMGLGALAPFGGYAIYFPELFPTRLRTTGTGFCYNVGRYVAAFGPMLMGQLTSMLAGKYDVSSIRLAALIVCFCYAIGIVALIWAPETKDEPLMDDERVAAH